jgi:ribose/xylose/arabinose/galactoside ABC-type transport system permease subunit
MVVLDGTGLLGGQGGVGGTALGVLFIGILQNGLSLSGAGRDVIQPAGASTAQTQRS